MENIRNNSKKYWRDKMKKLLLAILLFSACGKEVDKEVKVVDKFKTEAYTETYIMPMYIGKVVRFVPRVKHIPEKYYLKVEWVEIKTKEVEINIDEFESTKLGDTKIIKIEE